VRIGWGHGDVAGVSCGSGISAGWFKFARFPSAEGNL